MKVIVIDNYDSFTYNLVHYLEELNCTVIVKRNDQVNLSEIEGFDRIVLSPGPGIPEEAGLLKQIISKYASTKNILGVCLGHQAIAEVFGAELENLKSVFHGVASEINIIKNDPLFKDLNNPLTVGRYHSWVVKEPLPECLEVLAFDENKQIMALKHKEYKIRGVQFHPESILTEQGKTLLKNWLNII
ncbi:MAG: anthranilate synthase component II [Flavobacteriales bacterium]|jgi:anthranilate synthase component 2|tara:strand:- start:3286 stop:3849 length:564 start_codon:yes stop_codon:yes gene_type:complete